MGSNMLRPPNFEGGDESEELTPEEAAEMRGEEYTEESAEEEEPNQAQVLRGIAENSARMMQQMMKDNQEFMSNTLERFQTKRREAAPKKEEPQYTLSLNEDEVEESPGLNRIASEVQGIGRIVEQQTKATGAIMSRLDKMANDEKEAATNRVVGEMNDAIFQMIEKTPEFDRLTENFKRGLIPGIMSALRGMSGVDGSNWTQAAGQMVANEAQAMNNKHVESTGRQAVEGRRRVAPSHGRAKDAASIPPVQRTSGTAPDGGESPGPKEGLMRSSKFKNSAWRRGAGLKVLDYMMDRDAQR